MACPNAQRDLIPTVPLVGSELNITCDAIMDPETGRLGHRAFWSAPWVEGRKKDAELMKQGKPPLCGYINAKGGGKGKKVKKGNKGEKKGDKGKKGKKGGKPLNNLSQVAAGMFSGLLNALGQKQSTKQGKSKKEDTAAGGANPPGGAPAGAQIPLVVCSWGRKLSRRGSYYWDFCGQNPCDC